MRSAVLILSVIFVLCQISECYRNVDYSYLSAYEPASLEIIGNETYYVSPAGANTNIEALRFCNDIGMVLVSFETVEKYEMIKQHLNTIGSGSVEFWTSGRRWKEDGWVWTSIGEQFTFTDWYEASDEPDFGGDNDPCVTFRADTGMYDEPQPFTCAFICQTK